MLLHNSILLFFIYLCNSMHERKKNETIKGLDFSKYATSNRRTLRRNTNGMVVPSSPIFVTLMKEAPGSSETSVLTRATRRNNPEDTILYTIHDYGQLGRRMFSCEMRRDEDINVWRIMSGRICGNTKRSENRTVYVSDFFSCRKTGNSRSKEYQPKESSLISQKVTVKL
jgi:hypothetical protein